MKKNEYDISERSSLLLRLAQEVVAETQSIVLCCGLKREDTENVLRLALEAERISYPATEFGKG
ncbi:MULTISPECIES: hypothetical protein [Raoultella]|uniref:hypothetical protein n=1 Tax=Raoultella TaxID=160674 RepID=UPI001E39EA32|nr:MULTISPECIES: hypothetical protein [Raoultella]MCC2035044.1 hypothetical protein [Raoultella ornithinolytica]MCC2041587.1 hypothetical protein [Raoultella ornithinolytica]MCC2046562.1 hypothetical protein [Raoultella ornithinolytica]MCC2052281.1 hypothetical protein [Raoultella ornithinolytica]MCC2056614.1 hypothetical protein [Raoultella ornithinolytica]